MTRQPNERFPSAGPPFQVGEHVVMFPAVVGPAAKGPASVYLDWDEMVIDDINEVAESFGFHFTSAPGIRHAQGLENVVRKDAAYEAWRAMWQGTFERTGSEEAANAASRHLWLRVLAEHPIHGREGPSRHPALG